VAGFALTGALAPELHAATIIPVTNTFDSGSGSLRDALAIANNGDTIDATGVSGTIRLMTGALVVDKNVTISGPGATRLSINGRGQMRILEISNDGNQGIVEISGVSIENGQGDMVLGAGVRIEGRSSLRLQKSDVKNNRARVGGVGITNYGYLELIACNVIGNTSSRGPGSEVEHAGGILNYGEAHIIASMINNNCGLRGGGIENISDVAHRGLLAISGSTLSGNHAAQGGAIINHGHLYISTSTIDSNMAAVPRLCDGVENNTPPRRWNGGAISNGDNATKTGDIHIRLSTISNNHALRGGGIENLGYAEIFNSTISGNSAARGGAIYNTGPARCCPLVGKVDINFSTITDNSVTYDSHILLEPSVGGGIDNEALVNMGSTILADNMAHAGELYSPDCFSRTDHSNASAISERNNVVGVINENCNLEDYFWGDLRFDQHGTEGQPLEPWPGPPPGPPPLANNGGPTKTHALFQGSPAINSVIHGPVECPETDQRGRLRPAGPHCDAGAFEFP